VASVAAEIPADRSVGARVTGLGGYLAVGDDIARFKAVQHRGDGPLELGRAP